MTVTRPAKWRRAARRDWTAPAGRTNPSAVAIATAIATATTTAAAVPLTQHQPCSRTAILFPTRSCALKLATHWVVSLLALLLLLGDP